MSSSVSAYEASVQRLDRVVGVVGATIALGTVYLVVAAALSWLPAREFLTWAVIASAALLFPTWWWICVFRDRNRVSRYVQEYDERFYAASERSDRETEADRPSEYDLAPPLPVQRHWTWVVVAMCALVVCAAVIAPA